MFCPKCGNQIPDNSGFCGRCGAQLSPVQPQQGGYSPQPQQGGYVPQTQTAYYPVPGGIPQGRSGRSFLSGTADFINLIMNISGALLQIITVILWFVPGIKVTILFGNEDISPNKLILEVLDIEDMSTALYRIGVAFLIILALAAVASYVMSLFNLHIPRLVFPICNACISFIFLLVMIIFTIIAHHATKEAMGLGAVSLAFGGILYIFNCIVMIGINCFAIFLAISSKKPAAPAYRPPTGTNTPMPPVMY